MTNYKSRGRRLTGIWPDYGQKYSGIFLGNGAVFALPYNPQSSTR